MLAGFKGLQILCIGFLCEERISCYTNYHLLICQQKGLREQKFVAIVYMIESTTQSYSSIEVENLKPTVFLLRVFK